MNLKINALGSFCNSWPILTITQNNNKFEYSIQEETTLNIVLDNAPFQIGMYNKSFGTNRVWDTKTDSDGNIIQDKSIKINLIEIDEVDISHLLIKLDYNSIEQGYLTIHDSHIRFNGEWNFPTGKNPYDWIIDTTYQQTNEYRDVSYFSDSTIINNYRDHHHYIQKIKKLLDI